MDPLLYSFLHVLYTYLYVLFACLTTQLRVQNIHSFIFYSFSCCVKYFLIGLFNIPSLTIFKTGVMRLLSGQVTFTWCSCKARTNTLSPYASCCTNISFDLWSIHLSLNNSTLFSPIISLVHFVIPLYTINTGNTETCKNSSTIQIIQLHLNLSKNPF